MPAHLKRVRCYRLKKKAFFDYHTGCILRCLDAWVLLDITLCPVPPKMKSSQDEVADFVGYQMVPSECLFPRCNYHPALLEQQIGLFPNFLLTVVLLCLRQALSCCASSSQQMFTLDTLCVLVKTILLQRVWCT